MPKVSSEGGSKKGKPKEIGRDVPQKASIPVALRDSPLTVTRRESAEAVSSGTKLHALPDSLSAFSRKIIADPHADAKIQKMRESRMFDSLNLEKTDWQNNLATLWSVYQDNIGCRTAKKGKCANPTGYHLTAELDAPRRRVTLAQTVCVKHLKTLSEYSGSKNFLARPQGGIFETPLPTPKRVFNKMVDKTQKAVGEWWVKL